MLRGGWARPSDGRSASALDRWAEARRDLLVGVAGPRDPCIGPERDIERPGRQGFDDDAGGPGDDERGEVVRMGGELVAGDQRTGVEDRAVGPRRETHHEAAGAQPGILVDLETGEQAVLP